MRAGKLDRVVMLQHRTETVNGAGTVTDTWATFATLRAELVNLAAIEADTAFGEAETSSLVLRTRYTAGVSTGDRAVIAGEAFDIKAVLEIGRRRGLELRVERAE